MYFNNCDKVCCISHLFFKCLLSSAVFLFIFIFFCRAFSSLHASIWNVQADMGLWPTPHLSGEGGSGGRKRHPCRDHFEICEDFRAIWTRCQSAPDSKGWQRYPTVQYGSLFNELLTVPRFNWCDIWAIYLWHFNEGWFSALPFTFLCYFLRVICIFLL